MAAKKLTAAQKKKLKEAAAKKKKAQDLARKAKINADNTKYKPANYLRGDKNPGRKYTAWNTYGQGTPDLGKKAGPGDPYHEVQAVIPSRTKAIIDRTRRIGDENAAKVAAQRATTAEPQSSGPTQSTQPAKPPTKITKPISKPVFGSVNRPGGKRLPSLDFRSQAIRNRLSGAK